MKAARENRGATTVSNGRPAEARANRPDEPAEREALAARLREEIDRRTRAEQALEASRQELQEFVYIASHDLQEPLRKILSFADLLCADCGDVLPENGRAYVERMQDAAQRMTVLLRDLLVFSRVQTRPQPFERLDLNAVVSDVLADLETLLRETGATVDVGPLPTIEADAAQMRQLFHQLIGNALKFHREDAPPRVEVSAEEACGEGAVETCRIVVRDEGIGFDEQYAERIFAPFQRLHGRGVYPGSGMGLPICRRIAERHRGTLGAEGAPGRGATFVVTLPLRQPADPA